MPPHAGEDVWVRLRQLDCTRTAREVGADGNDFGNARLAGTGDHLRELVRKVGIVEMSVGVVKDRHEVKVRAPGEVATEIRSPISETRKKAEDRSPEFLGLLSLGAVGNSLAGR